MQNGGYISQRDTGHALSNNDEQPQCSPLVAVGCFSLRSIQMGIGGSSVSRRNGCFHSFLFQCIQISIRFLFDFSSIIQKVRYGKRGNSQCAQCVLYLSSRNMKTKNVSRDTFQIQARTRASPGVHRISTLLNFRNIGIRHQATLVSVQRSQCLDG